MQQMHDPNPVIPSADVGIARAEADVQEYFRSPLLGCPDAQGIRETTFVIDPSLEVRVELVNGSESSLSRLIPLSQVGQYVV